MKKLIATICCLLLIVLGIQGLGHLVRPTDTDDEIKAFLSESFGLRQPTDLQLYSHDRRLDILRMSKQYGASIRQLERLTGISFTIVRMA